MTPEQNTQEKIDTLRTQVKHALDNYYNGIGDVKPANVYDMVMGEIEPPLLKATLAFVNGNQTLAAKVLGISRGTLRKKLETHHLIAAN